MLLSDRQAEHSDSDPCVGGVEKKAPYDFGSQYKKEGRVDHENGIREQADKHESHSGINEHKP